MSTLVVGGVPEHFNLPWHLAIASGDFAEAGLDVQWKVQASGTGQMMAALAEGELDVAIALTDGVIAAITRGNPSRIVGLYTQSPLLWGVHVAAGSSIRTLSDITADHRFAISRFGSGSHLMAHVLGHEHDLEFFESSFEIVGDLAGGVSALTGGRADVFLWDTFMTSTFVESGELHRAGIQPTPWPAFVVAATNEALAKKAPEIQLMLEIVAGWEQRFSDTPTEFIAAMVSREFGLSPQNSRQWRADTVWNCGAGLDPDVIANAQSVLVDTGVVTGPLPIAELIYPL